MDLTPNLVLDRKYRLLHALGEGAFGAVWLAQDAVLGDRHVAIKFLKTASPGQDEDFVTEMRALAGLKLPGIVTFHHHFKYQDQLALVMEHCAGGSLLQRLRTPLSGDTETWVTQVASWALQLCDTLGVALGTGVAGAILAAGENLDWTRGTALTVAFALCGAIALVTAVAATRLPALIEAAPG